MLDTNARKYVQPALEGVAKQCIKYNLTANHITTMALMIGMLASCFVYYDFPIIAVMLLWISGIFDAVDGTIARLTSTSSKWGTLMDLVFDRFVEMSIIVALVLRFNEIMIYFIFLLCSILFSMCVFLTVGALSTNNANKSFRYQAGVIERSEAFVCFSSMILLDNHLKLIVSIMTILVTFTAIQRMIEAKRIFSED